MHKNNYQMLRKIKRLGILNARENINDELEKLGCRPVFYNDNTKRKEVIYHQFVKSEEESNSKEEQEKIKKIKALCDKANIDFSVLCFIDNVPFED